MRVTCVLRILLSRMQLGFGLGKKGGLGQYKKRGKKEIKGKTRRPSPGAQRKRKWKRTTLGLAPARKIKEKKERRSWKLGQPM